MKAFNFNKKTGEFEYRITSIISKLEIKALLFMRNNGHKWAGGYATHEDLENLFAADILPHENPDEWRNNAGQFIHDITWHIQHELGFIEFDPDRNVYVGHDKKTKQNQYKKVSGYFLTNLGKAFCSMWKDKRKDDGD